MKTICIWLAIIFGRLGNLAWKLNELPRKVAWKCFSTQRLLERRAFRPHYLDNDWITNSAKEYREVFGGHWWE